MKENKIIKGRKDEKRGIFSWLVGGWEERNYGRPRNFMELIRSSKKITMLNVLEIPRILFKDSCSWNHGHGGT